MILICFKKTAGCKFHDKVIEFLEESVYSKLEKSFNQSIQPPQKSKKLQHFASALKNIEAQLLVILKIKVLKFPDLPNKIDDLLYRYFAYVRRIL